MILCCLAVVSVTAADGPVQKDRPKIKELVKAGDVAKIDEYAETALTKWENSPDGVYAQLMSEIAQEISDAREQYGLMKSYMLQRKYVLRALKGTKYLGANFEETLVGKLSIGKPSGSISEETFVAERKIDVAVRLRFWRRILNEIDPKWKPVLIIWTDSIPPLVHPGGRDASGKTDPERDRQAIAKIEEDREKKMKLHKINTTQFMLRELRDKFIPKMEKYIVEIYSTPPYNTAELSELLDKYKIDEVSKKRILDSVAAKTKSQ